MASGITTAFWGMTINNYDESDLALVQNGYADYCREIVHTLEEGSEGTPHIQAWIKLQRQQRLSFVKKLFPRGHFKPLTSDEYIQNTKVYAQKSDDTTRSASVHRFNDPLNTIESVIRKVVEEMIETRGEDDEDIDVSRRYVEKYMVRDDYKLAKIFVSQTYKQMWKQFGNEMYSNLFRVRMARIEAEHEQIRAEIEGLLPKSSLAEKGVRWVDTHTHTHTQSGNISSRVDIPTTDASNDYQEGEGESSRSQGDDEDYEDGASSASEGFDTSGCSSDCEEDDG